MTRDITSQPPIGYWLKHADEIITARSNQALADQGFTRFRWQALNMIYEAGTITRDEVFNVLQTFIDAHQLDEMLGGFVREGWLVVEGNALSLTEAGKSKRADLFKRQGEVRRRAMQGISDEEYVTIIAVLQRMVNNLA
jgi:DNA-binding MarR family transcriptional regulator